MLVEATVKLDELVKKIGKAVEDSKPYWEARRVARQVSVPLLPTALHGAVGTSDLRAPLLKVGAQESRAFSRRRVELVLCFPTPQPPFIPALSAVTAMWVLTFGRPTGGFPDSSVGKESACHEETLV